MPDHQALLLLEMEANQTLMSKLAAQDKLLGECEAFLDDWLTDICRCQKNKVCVSCALLTKLRERKG